MKKIFTILTLAVLLSLPANAQEVAPQRIFTPEKGDIALGVDLKPILNYVGNIFNGTEDNKLSNLGGEPIIKGGVAPDVSLMGKYMLTDNWGLRANIGFLFRTNSNKFYVADDKAQFLNPLDESKVVDVESQGMHGMSLMLGGEYRVGHKRVQGVFSAGLLLGLNNSSTSYKYGNELTSINQNPSSAFPTYTNGYRILTEKSASDFYYGLILGAGVEWFVAPKIALGTEVNISLCHTIGSQVSVETEGFNTITNKIEKRNELTSPGNDSFTFGTDNVGGSLYIAFYF